MTESIRNTLVSLARDRAEKMGAQPAYTYLDDRFDNPRVITWGELDERARALAVRLEANCARGDRALVVLPSGPEFLFAFFGCLYAGVIAVPTSEPQRATDVERLAGLLAS